MLIAFEVRRAARSLLRHPALTTLAVLALGIGIGLPTAMFSIVDAAVLRGLPVAQPARLMHLERRTHGATGEGMAALPRDYTNWRAQQHSFSDLGAFRTLTVALRSGTNVDRWSAALVTPNIFRMLGVQALRGRAFSNLDTGANASASVLLSYKAWRDRYASDSQMVGRTVIVDGTARTVVGIMPESFRFPANEDVWLPFVIPVSSAESEQVPSFDVIGTLRDGVSKAQATSEFKVIAARMAAAYPATNKNLDITVKPYTERFMGEAATGQLYVLLVAVLLVLIVACANVANLLLVRGVQRTREIAISVALGASRARITSQLLIESLLLAVAGSIVGLIIAQLAVMAMTRAFVSQLPYWARPQLDARVLLFALMLTVLAAVLAVLAPALRISGNGFSAALREDARGATGAAAGRMMKALVVLELALSMGLLVNTGLLSQGAARARNVDVGIPHTGIFTAEVAVPESFSSANRLQFFQQLEARIQSDPAIASAGLISTLPGTHAPLRRVMIEGVVYPNTESVPAIRYASASASLFPALHITPVSGRVIDTHDVIGGELVAVVNQRFVQRYFPGVDAVGKRIRLGVSDTLPWRRIVGVVPDLWMGAFDNSSDRNPAGIYLPLAQVAPTSMSIAAQVKTGPALAVTAAVRAATFAVNSQIPIYDVRDMPQVVQDGTWFYGMTAGILGVCGASALLLATVGVYGVIAFSVGRRKREFGIRMALGASSNSIVALVLSQGLAQIVIGLAIGAALAIVLARGIAGMIFNGTPFNALLLALVAVGLASVAIIAMLIPTTSIARISPVSALKSD